jgi:radical SAM superfamily enzyme with C-terminal helix-hairpin-helix motif
MVGNEVYKFKIRKFKMTNISITELREKNKTNTREEAIRFIKEIREEIDHKLEHDLISESGLNSIDIDIEFDRDDGDVEIKYGTFNGIQTEIDFTLKGEDLIESMSSAIETSAIVYDGVEEPSYS